MKNFWASLNGSILTKSSKEKINNFIPEFDLNLQNNALKILLYKFIQASTFVTTIREITSPRLTDLKKKFIDFDVNYNNIMDSQYQRDIRAMQYSASFELQINANSIKTHFLFGYSQDIHYIVHVLHALATFCHVFPHNYDGLTIYVSLDDNSRQIKSIGTLSMDEIFYYLKKKSLAFNTSGYTNVLENMILLTKKEEIVKLLYHELVHYVGLDVGLNDLNFNWAVDKKIIFSEAYTEFLSVIFTLMYYVIFIYLQNDTVNVYDFFEFILNLEYNYSLYLTATILKFYGYDTLTLHDFFDNVGKTMNSPIYIWEYVVLRTVFFDNMSQIFPTNDFKMNDINKKKLQKFENRSALLEKLMNYISKINGMGNVSYMMLDVDWNSIKKDGSLIK